MRVRISEVKAIISRKSEINGMDFDAIEWVDDDGRRVEVPTEVAEWWKFTGLNNLDFVHFMVDEAGKILPVPPNERI